jgi:hypothetical protein
MHGDEPDNAQSLGRGYGPPIPPAKIIADYHKLKKAAPSRPVLLNLGQGVPRHRRRSPKVLDEGEGRVILQPVS